MVTSTTSIDRNDPGTWPVALSVHDVALILGLSESGIYRMIQKKQIPARKVGGAVRISKTALLKMLES